MNKSNYILLGVAISYILIAIIQIKTDGLLPTTVYVTAAFVSLELATFEMLKSTMAFLMHNLKLMNTVTKSRTKFIARSIKIYGKFNILDSAIEVMKNELTMLPNKSILARNNREIKKMKKLLSVVSCIQIIICIVQIMITPLKLIPYDNLTNEVINVVTLISFKKT